MKITLEKDTSKRIGLGKDLFTYPENFDEIDISNDFEGRII